MLQLVCKYTVLMRISGKLSPKKRPKNKLRGASENEPKNMVENSESLGALNWIRHVQMLHLQYRTYAVHDRHVTVATTIDCSTMIKKYMTESGRPRSTGSESALLLHKCKTPN